MSTNPIPVVVTAAIEHAGALAYAGTQMEREGFHDGAVILTAEANRILDAVDRMSP